MTTNNICVYTLNLFTDKNIIISHGTLVLCMYIGIAQVNWHQLCTFGFTFTIHVIGATNVYSAVSTTYTDRQT